MRDGGTGIKSWRRKLSTVLYHKRNSRVGDVVLKDASAAGSTGKNSMNVG